MLQWVINKKRGYGYSLFFLRPQFFYRVTINIFERLPVPCCILMI